MFLTSMKKLYDVMGLDDFNEKLIQIYYNRYIELHKVT